MTPVVQNTLACQLSGTRTRFHQYGLGLRGLSAHRSFMGTLWMDPGEAPQALADAFEVAFNHTVMEYGVYFYGSSVQP